MQYRSLGRSGLKVSELCLGAMMFGGQTDEPTSKRIIDKARDKGVNFIDTADVYNAGKSEEVVGRAVAAQRDDWIIATKVAGNMGRGPNESGASRKWIMREADDSLKRLGTSYIDVYYLHREDHSTPLAETARAMGDLMAQGKIRYFGVSNYRSWRIAEMCRICDDLGIDRPVVSQPAYNAMNRTPEIEHLPACDYYGLGVVPYSPLARGVLTGKYDPDAQPAADTRAARNDPRLLQTEFRRESMQHAREIKSHVEAKGANTTAFAVQWVLNNASVSSVIAGPRTEEQWDDYLAALDYGFTPEDEALVNRLVVTGHPSTPGYNDPAYPIEGRRVRVAAAT
ncbi:aldo/keto reductase [Phenylobacterium sp.]|uniref:aldo/keto reductase n=1 Tax=Phenylobacterium sp. TaxID=1871053 RepID=UPI0027363824|nr:aldo/keto reductase [Phenylobacterium sp.]MDP3660437.1 aldo/keto reductase [Phenylobacterium sp.]